MVWMLLLHHNLRMMASRNHEVADVVGVIVVRVAADAVVSAVSETAFAEIEAPSAVVTEVVSAVVSAVVSVAVSVVANVVASAVGSTVNVVVSVVANVVVSIVVCLSISIHRIHSRHQ
jgi:hypothetical protein